MTTQARKIRVGVFTVAAVALFVVVLVVFGGLRVWAHRDHYRIVFSSSVMGLEAGAEVYVDGVHVGQVDGIELARNDLRKVVVAIEVERGTPVHTDTRATLSLAGITGLKVIELRGGTYAAPRVPEDGMIAEGTGMLDKLEQQAETLAERSTQVLDRVDRVLDNLAQITDPRRFAAIDDVVAQARVTAGNLAAASASMRAMIDDDRAALRDTLASGAKVAAGANDLVTQVRALVQANAGPVRAAVFDLRQASRSLKDLAREVRERPSRLLYSSAPEERAAP